MGRLRNAQLGTPGYSHFPADHQQPYFEQLLGETLVTTYSRGQPVREWRPKKGVRHEALDARVYAYAALRALISMGLVLDVECDRIGTLRKRVDAAGPSIARFNRSRWMEEWG
jgi:phage terminase large subunit GpA-like protein